MARVHQPSQHDPRSMLVVLPTWVGDFVMATPTLRAIRARFSRAHITFLIEPNLRELVRGGDWMNEVVEWPAKEKRSPLRRVYRDFAWDLRRRRFDWAVLLPNSFRAALIARIAGATRRIGYDRDGRGFLLTDRLTVANRRGRRRRNRGVAARGWAAAEEATERRSDGGTPHSSELRNPCGVGSGTTDEIGVSAARGSDDVREFAQAQARGSARGSLGGSADGEGAGVEGVSGVIVGSGYEVPVTMGERLPVPLTRYVPMPLVEYYADLAEALGCERPGDALELFTTADCDAAVESRLRELGLGGRRPGGWPGCGSVSEGADSSGNELTARSCRGRGAEGGGDVGPEGGGGTLSGEMDERPMVVISPGAKYGAAKCWFPERFAAVADRLVERDGVAVVITCGPGEEPIAREIGTAMRHDAIVMDDPRLSLGELKSLIRRCDLLICNDAGPRHVAKAFGVPVVTIFGPTHPDWTATGYADERIVRVDVDCGPCQQRTCPLGHLNCLEGVTVGAVYAAAVELLRPRVAGRVQLAHHE